MMLSLLSLCVLVAISIAAPATSCSQFQNLVKSTELLGTHAKHVEKQLPSCPTRQVGIRTVEKENFLQFSASRAQPVSTVVHTLSKVGRNAKHISVEAVVPELKEGVEHLSILRVVNVDNQDVLSLEWERDALDGRGRFYYVQRSGETPDMVTRCPFASASSKTLRFGFSVKQGNGNGNGGTDNGTDNGNGNGDNGDDEDDEDDTSNPPNPSFVAADWGPPGCIFSCRVFECTAPAVDVDMSVARVETGVRVLRVSKKDAEARVLLRKFAMK